jgi:hypothetical protein
MDSCFSEPVFARTIADRAADDLPRLATLAPLNEAVSLALRGSKEGEGEGRGCALADIRLPTLTGAQDVPGCPW